MTVVVVLVLVGGVVTAKLMADRTASEQVDARTAEVQELLAGSSAEDFLAFNSGSRTEGSVARAVSDQDDFVSVDARAERAVIRFQPEGWWQGFTERCLVAVVPGTGEIELTTLKTACVRVDPADW